MKDRFLDVLKVTLGFEGGYSDDPDDKGGETNLGITEGTFARAKVAGLVSKDMDIKDLTRFDAARIYKKFFWEPTKCYLLPAPLDLIIFDCAVNHRPDRAVKLLQKAINSFDNFPKLIVDGSFGPMTTKAVQAFIDINKTMVTTFPQLGPNFLIKQLAKTILLERAKKFSDIVTHDHTQKKFFHGWIRQRVVNLGLKTDLL